jgi:copper(I)-binding protein
LAAFCAALPTAAEVTVSEPWARASILANRPGAAYLTLQSDVADRLMSLGTPVAGQVMLHGTETDANGVARMAHIEALNIEPGTPSPLPRAGCT